MKSITEQWCWMLGSEERYHLADSEAEAHNEAKHEINDLYDEGQVIEYIVARPAHPIDAVGEDWLKKAVAEHIMEEIDLWCGEEIGADDIVFDISDEDKAALGKLVVDFVRKNANTSWYGIVNETRSTHEFTAGSIK